MGKKHARKGQHFLFYLTGILMLLTAIAACSSIQDAEKVLVQIAPGTLQAEGRLEDAKILMAEGNFKAANRINEQVLSSHFTSLGDRSMYQLGVLWAHPDNPAADSVKARWYFQQVGKIFPDSPLTAEAAVWLRVLQVRAGEQAQTAQEILAQQDQNTECTSKLKSLHQRLEAQTTVNTELRSQTKSLKSEVAALNQQINQLKSVDIGIEEKKRSRPVE